VFANLSSDLKNYAFFLCNAFRKRRDERLLRLVNEFDMIAGDLSPSPTLEVEQFRKDNMTVVAGKSPSYCVARRPRAMEKRFVCMRCQHLKTVRHLSARCLTVLLEPDRGQAHCQSLQYLSRRKVGKFD
jgi:hypothetical protein